MSCDMQRGSESCAANLQQLSEKLFRLLLLQESRCRWRCSHGVSAVCCMYRDERVIFVVNAACLFFFSPSYVQTWGVFGSFVHAEVVCQCAYENWTTEISPGPLASVATGEQANECLKLKQGEEGRKEGGRGWERGKRIHALWRMDRAGGLSQGSTPLGLCKCIVSKLCYMFDSLTSLVRSTTLLFVPSCLSLLSSFILSPYTLPLPLSASPSLSLSIS